VRRLSTVLALLGCIVHAMVLPWWAGSRLPAHWSAAALSADLSVICQGGAADADVPLPSQQDPNSECPICKGLMGLQFAILVAAQAGLLERVANIQRIRLPQVEPRKNIVFSPRNRGPPLLV
jgi:hypothetical protein